MGRVHRGVRLGLSVIGLLLTTLFVRGCGTVVGLQVGRWYFLTFGGGILFALMLRAQWDWLSRRQVVALGGCVFGALLILGLPFTSRDFFLMDFNRIAPGMTKSEVETIMEDYLTGTGIPQFPGVTTIVDGSHRYEVDPSASDLSPRGCQTFRHSTDAAWNADWGTVCYENGKVTSVSFSPD